MCDGQGRPILLLLSEGQMSDHTAALLIDRLPRAKTLIGDKGYDSDAFRAAASATTARFWST